MPSRHLSVSLRMTGIQIKINFHENHLLTNACQRRRVTLSHLVYTHSKSTTKQDKTRQAANLLPHTQSCALSFTSSEERQKRRHFACLRCIVTRCCCCCCSCGDCCCGLALGFLVREGNAGLLLRTAAPPLLLLPLLLLLPGIFRLLTLASRRATDGLVVMTGRRLPTRGAS